MVRFIGLLTVVRGGRYDAASMKKDNRLTSYVDLINGESLDQLLAVRISGGMFQEIKQASTRTGISRPELVRVILNEGLKRCNC